MTEKEKVRGMREERLLKNITDQIKEAQIKLGYVRETVRLYYPLSSLKAILQSEVTGLAQMKTQLEHNEVFQHSPLGPIRMEIHGDRMELSISPEGCAYVHGQVDASPFLRDIIELFATHHACSIAQVQEVFARYSTSYVCQQMEPGMDFDYVLYFTESGVDEYYYCVRMEMGHTIYHRFMKEDFELL
ncbi:MAG: DUF3877 family protein [Lachnospiraceae bacterium]|nr:DUF3877 family protein [Lachnospiraceae bacterium]